MDGLDAFPATSPRNTCPASQLTPPGLARPTAAHASIDPRPEALHPTPPGLTRPAAAHPSTDPPPQSLAPSAAAASPPSCGPRLHRLTAHASHKPRPPTPLHNAPPTPRPRTTTHALPGPAPRSLRTAHSAGIAAHTPCSDRRRTGCRFPFAVPSVRDRQFIDPGWRSPAGPAPCQEQRSGAGVSPETKEAR